ncbi:PREDICTED: L-Ala-D/L-amino acid epimerase isoform X1 [Theobroma cacao]|uniref:L-Ala-D/L-amino acid epimerase isoform X1 n=2 Tax=Theobroma cacao TaxID=3641 RepID=A0AB32V6S6_THECC|nr:PREDICTED: L-Ala-D/L-amino acid epimerase isoform X1 [Theobroma cacao]
MASFAFYSALFSTNSLLLPPCVHRLPIYLQTKQNISQFSVIASSSTGGSELTTEAAVTKTESERTSFGFKNLTETFWVDVHRAEGRPLSVRLNESLTFASSKLEKVESVVIRVELRNGCVGWGEVPVLPLGNWNQAMALEKVKEACKFLGQGPPLTLNLVLDKISENVPGREFASVRAGLEMALIDAAANSIGVPLWRLFGGVSNTLSTAATIPTASLVKAFDLAAKYCKLGFKILELRVGRDLNADIEVLQAVRAAHPHCLFILDANEQYTSKEAIEVLEKLNEKGATPVLFEQPVHRDDWRGLSEVSTVAREKYGISVAADESCRNLVDIQKLIQENIVDVINIKLSKFGVLGTLEIVEMVKKSKLNLMIDSVAETRLAAGVAGHLAAGLGCFKYVNLSAPILLSEDPVVGGYEVSGSNHKFVNSRGQGGFLKWDIASWIL